MEESKQGNRKKSVLNPTKKEKFFVSFEADHVGVRDGATVLPLWLLGSDSPRAAEDVSGWSRTMAELFSLSLFQLGFTEYGPRSAGRELCFKLR